MYSDPCSLGSQLERNLPNYLKTLSRVLWLETLLPICLFRERFEFSLYFDNHRCTTTWKTHCRKHEQQLGNTSRLEWFAKVAWWWVRNKGMSTGHLKLKTDTAEQHLSHYKLHEENVCRKKKRDSSMCKHGGRKCTCPDLSTEDHIPTNNQRHSHWSN